jgi:hypothetical protein
MTTDRSTASIALGFLSVFSPSSVGFVGGLLVLNQRARPLEFHCTAAVQPSRALELLYGATFRPYLFGEQIGGTLLKRAQARLSLCLTDTIEVLAAREVWPHPLIGLESSEMNSEHSAAERAVRATGAQREGLDLTPVDLQGHAAWVVSSAQQDHAQALRVLEQCSRFDLLEPFQRLRDAIEEAHRSQAA